MWALSVGSALARAWTYRELVVMDTVTGNTLIGAMNKELSYMCRVNTYRKT
ncbi:hypothetical protein DPMN_154072 [Dreissena polymorpha]|uniref:Uncharacterized protein n=1 Tax=Dreissena polymorpha TaxID=45954 RepID=A0A9D4FJR5_DREPO|nr:hypothetical protein DPMN_154072 [Dreissena polymorpha]